MCDVDDDSDICQGAALDVPIDTYDCSGQQLVDMFGGPCDYSNHDGYMSELEAAANMARDSGLPTNEERAV